MDRLAALSASSPPLIRRRALSSRHRCSTLEGTLSHPQGSSCARAGRGRSRAQGPAGADGLRPDLHAHLAGIQALCGEVLEVSVVIDFVAARARSWPRWSWAAVGRAARLLVARRGAGGGGRGGAGGQRRPALLRRGGRDAAAPAASARDEAVPRAAKHALLKNRWRPRWRRPRRFCGWRRRRPSATARC